MISLLPAPVKAGDAENSGVIIISREVYYRSAISPSVPGPAVTVDTSPDDLVIASTAQGLKPLTDNEAASLTAPMTAAGPAIKGATQHAVTMLALSRGPRTFDPGQVSGGASSNSIVGQAVGAIPTALNSLRSALGTGQ